MTGRSAKDKLRPIGWQGRITLNNGQRPWMEPFRRKMSAERADKVVEETAKHARNENWTELPRSQTTHGQPIETVGQYFAGWQADRVERGFRDTETEKSRFEHHVGAHLRRLQVTAVTPEHLERLVASLERKVREDKLKWKTINNVWAGFKPARFTAEFLQLVSCEKSEMGSYLRTCDSPIAAGAATALNSRPPER